MFRSQAQISRCKGDITRQCVAGVLLITALMSCLHGSLICQPMERAGSVAQGQPGDHFLREADARHLTPGELVKLSFPDNVLGGVEEANQPSAAAIPAERLPSITVTDVKTLAAVYRRLAQKTTSGDANVSAVSLHVDAFLRWSQSAEESTQHQLGTYRSSRCFHQWLQLFSTSLRQ